MNERRSIVRFLALPIALLLTACAAGTAAPARPPSTLVHTQAGDLRGARDGDVLRFRGVPYAQVPTGDLRWAPPRPAKPWHGTRDATKSGPRCAQPGNPPDNSTAEDCLYVDVTTPATANHQRRPVLVWLHGGGFTTGAGSEYDPARIVTRGDLIVVTVDFRLGVLGNLTLPGMTDGGSYGLQDQQAALRWVRSNAAVFGGDPHNVTLAGQSGGAIGVCGQLTSPGARGLFDRAILESGSCETALNANSSGPDTKAFGAFWRQKDDAEQTGATAAATLGCTDPATALDCLRLLPVDKLLTQSGTITAATVGGHTLPMDPREALRRGRFTHVPVLSGNTRDEQRLVSSIYALLSQPITAERYPGLLTAGFGADAAAVSAEYPLSAYPDAASAWAAAYTDHDFVCPQLRTDTALSRHTRVYPYMFADETAPPLVPALPGFDAGASHASELFYLFDLPGKPVRIDNTTYPLTEPQKRLAATMIDAWSAFIHTGRPGSWPSWRDKDSEVHTFTADEPTTTTPYDDHRCGFWNGLS
jgi:para-nitrobenzyl esterase